MKLFQVPKPVNRYEESSEEPIKNSRVKNFSGSAFTDNVFMKPQVIQEKDLESDSNFSSVEQFIEIEKKEEISTQISQSQGQSQVMNPVQKLQGLIYKLKDRQYDENLILDKSEQIFKEIQNLENNLLTQRKEKLQETDNCLKDYREMTTTRWSN
jgi:hypothetical protein